MEKTQPVNNITVQYKPREPRLYHVIMHNDDVTTMEFVIMVLVDIFRKSYRDAEQLMLKVHNEGSAIAGTYNRDIAMSKVRKVTELARANDFPLSLTIVEA